MGKKKQPTYRIVVSEKTKDPWGDNLEILGNYNPRSKVTEVKKDRILYWISKGAKPSPTVHNLLIDQNVIEAEKQVASSGKKRRKKAEAEKAAEAAKKPEGEEAKPADDKVKTEDKSAEDKPAEKAPKEEKKDEAPKEDKPVEKSEEKKEE